MVIERIFCFMMRVSGLGSCKEVQEICYEYVEASVDSGQKKRVEKHLKICKPCLRFITSYIAIRTLGKAAHPEKLSDSQKEKLIEGLMRA